MIERVIVSGFGGQGVLSAGVMMCEAGVTQGYQSTFFPSYGAEMRGGTANCNVILSDKLIPSPVIVVSDTLLALNMPSLVKFLPRVKDKGLIILNSSIIKEEINCGNRKLIKIPVEELALEKLGNPKVANSIIIGAYIKATGNLQIDHMKKAIEEKFSKKGAKIIDLNFKALELGYSAA
jgi:2-oxoglutarate ferredoxin oxidoreductase subunit gamma